MPELDSKIPNLGAQRQLLMRLIHAAESVRQDQIVALLSDIDENLLRLSYILQRHSYDRLVQHGRAHGFKPTIVGPADAAPAVTIAPQRL